MRKDDLWLGVAFALLLMFLSSAVLLSGKTLVVSRGVLNPTWIMWPLLFLGIIFLVLMIWQLWLHWNDPVALPPTDEDIKRAKEALDQMYFREHGKYPDPSDDEEEDR